MVLPFAIIGGKWEGERGGGENMLQRRLKEIRKARGIRQEEVANFLGVKRQTYSAYERSVSVPDSLTLKKLADFFEVSIEDFFLDPKDQSEEAHEKQLMILSRKARQIPPQYRERLIQNFEDNIELYLEMLDWEEVGVPQGKAQ